MDLALNINMIGAHLKIEVVTASTKDYMKNLGFFQTQDIKLMKIKYYHFMEEQTIIIQRAETKPTN